MNKQQLSDALQRNYQTFIDYISSLSDEDYHYRYQQKWTAGQQLEHIVLCVKPLVQVFGMEPAAVGKSFGTTASPGRSYDALLQEYTAKLNSGGKAPERYLPETAQPASREANTQLLGELVRELQGKIANFTEPELDYLYIPHPLLGNLTMREMLYNAIYHVEHHREATARHLENK